MKKILFLFIVLLFVATVYAIDCQYKNLEEYKQFGTYLYYGNSNKNSGEIFNASEFNAGYGNMAGPCEYSFKIFNPLPLDVTVEVKYSLDRSGVLFERSNRLVIERYSSALIKDVLDGVGGCAVVQDGISFVVLKPTKMISKKGYAIKEIEVCKKCNGKLCLNDNEKCAF